ncbi:MAG: Gfo/Idh/MocA family protein [Promethearchaeota archaeon]
MANQNKKMLNAAIVGIGRQYFDGHEAIYKIGKRFVPLAFVDLDEERATKAMNSMKQFLSKSKEIWAKSAIRSMKVFTSYDEMLNEMQGQIDFIDVITHNALHVPFAIKALEKNINVMVEKPPAMNWLETKFLVEAEKKSKAKYQLAEHFCFERPIFTLRKLMDEFLRDELGQIQYVEANFGHGGPYMPYYSSNETKLPHFIDFMEGGGGTLQDLGPHGISAAYWPLGDKIENRKCKTLILERRKKDRKMSGHIVDSPAEDFAVAEITCYDKKFGNEFVMKCTTSWCGQPKGDRIKIVGENGTVKLGRSKILKRREPIFIKNNGKIIHFAVKKDNYHPWHAKVREAQYFADQILEDKPSLCNSVYAHRLQQIISMHYFSKLKKREITIQEMDEWGEQILNECEGDWQKASKQICKEFSKAVDL